MSQQALLHKKEKKIGGKIVHIIFTLLLVCIVLMPFYVAVIYAFKPKWDVGVNRLALPTQWTLENFKIVMTQNDVFFTGYRNSLLNCIPTVLILMVITSMAAYILARNKGKFYNFMYTLMTIGILVPFQCIMLTVYLDFFHWNLTNSNLGYIIVRVGMQVSISILVVTSFVKTIPYELEEAARIDGASQFTTFWKIVFPLMRPVNITQLVLNSLFCWNDYNVAIVMLRSKESKTLPLAQIIYFNENTSELNYAFAFFLLTMVPILILYFCMQKYIVQGIMSGAVKG
jgi:raffinose/stachyose/melibiose transport system permease protein